MSSASCESGTTLVQAEASIEVVSTSAQETDAGILYTVELVAGASRVGFDAPYPLVTPTEYSVSITVAPSDSLEPNETAIMIVEVVATPGTWAGNTVVLPYYSINESGSKVGDSDELLIALSVDVATEGDTGDGQDTGEGTDTGDTVGETDVDGDGLVDGEVDKLISSGQILCFHEDLVDWDGEVYIVGYGFNGGDDWYDLSHETYADGTQTWHCYELPYTGDVYRVTVRGDDDDEWARLDAYCPYYVGDEPLCWQRDDGWSVCLDITDEGEIVPGECSDTG
jgi:hypothetical protein